MNAQNYIDILLVSIISLIPILSCIYIYKKSKASLPILFLISWFVFIGLFAATDYIYTFIAPKLSDELPSSFGFAVFSIPSLLIYTFLAIAGSGYICAQWLKHRFKNTP